MVKLLYPLAQSSLVEDHFELESEVPLRGTVKGQDIEVENHEILGQSPSSEGFLQELTLKSGDTVVHYFVKPHHSAAKRTRAQTGKAPKKVKETTTVRQNLAKWTADNLLVEMKGGVPLQLRENASLMEALHFLHQNRIHSVPLVDSETNTCHGFVDVLDILASVLEVVEAAQKMQTSKNPSMEEKEEADEYAEFVLGRVQAWQARNRSHRDPLKTVTLSTSAVQIAALLSSHDIHHVAVVDSENHFRGVISQSGLLEWMLTECVTGTQPRVADCHLPRTIKSVQASQTVLSAFQQLLKDRVTAEAVVRNGRIIGVLSASDLHLNVSVSVDTLSMSWLNLSILRMTVEQFLKEKDNARPLITVEEDTLLSDASEKMLVENVHRVFVNSKETLAPYTLLTPRDALRALLEE